MAFGYISGKTSSILLKTRVNLPLILTLSILPDADLLLKRILPIQHRVATHSLITALIAFAPFFLLYRKRTLPYFIAYVQHSLVGDFIVGSTQLLWPLSKMSFGLGIGITSLTNQSIEWVMFIAAIILMLKMKDYRTFFEPHMTNLILIIPTLTVLLPTFFQNPMQVPILLVPPHIFYLILFAAAMAIEIRALPAQLTKIYRSHRRQLVPQKEKREKG